MAVTSLRRDDVLPRREKLDRASRETFDVLVIGGGINGAGIAREATLRGLRTMLVEKGDFASGTSSKSSKLIHGGIRYLEEGDLGLVLEASRERDLLRRLAPHLVRPLPFLFPVYRGGTMSLWKLRAGLLIYDVLAAFRNIARHEIGRAEWTMAKEPALRGEGLRGAALYYDCFTDDARLVLETILAAEQAGAICLNYLELQSLEKNGVRIAGAKVRDRDDESGSMVVRARTVVNASGPWLDRIRALDDPAAPPILRPTKGVHLVVPRERVGNRHAIVLNAVRDGRVLFVIPWEDQTIIGTTDTDFAGDLDALETELEDVEYLLETANHYFPAAKLTDRDVVSTYAGLRPLIAGEKRESPSEVSREAALLESSSGLVSIGGGKLTTYRRVAVQVVDRLARILLSEHGIRCRKRSGTHVQPLPGGDFADLQGLMEEAEQHWPASPEQGRFLAGKYGTRYRDVIGRIAEQPELGAFLSATAPDVKAEAWFAGACEMALRVEDVLRRRTHIALRTLDQGSAAAAATAQAMAEPLGWDERTARKRADEYVGGTGDAWRMERLPQRKA